MRMKDTESMIKVLSENTDKDFDYSKSVYEGVRNKIIIGCYCEKRRDFEQTPEYHKHKGTCPYCARELANKNNSHRLTIPQLISKFNEVHENGTYDYSLINEENYINSETKVPIICNKHKEVFYQSPSLHKKGCGCPKCVKNYTDTEGFIKKAVEKGLDKNTSFEKVNYINSYTNVIFTCKIHHTDFEKRPDNFLSGRAGCPECLKTTFYTPETLALKLKELYGDKYKFFDLENYGGIKSKIKGFCKDHGYFKKRCVELVQGKGCPTCASENRKLTLDQIKEKALKLYKEELDDFSLMEYKNTMDKVKLRCLKHDKVYETTIGNYLSGHRCPSCASLVSKPETKVKEFVESLGYKVKNNTRSVISPKELDIYIPELNKAIEFNYYFFHFRFIFYPQIFSNM